MKSDKNRHLACTWRPLVSGARDALVEIRRACCSRGQAGEFSHSLTQFAGPQKISRPTRESELAKTSQLARLARQPLVDCRAAAAEPLVV